MATFEPPQSWQEEQHRRILRKDATAFAELCEAALPHLVEFLIATYPQVERHIHEMTAIDTLLSYNADPQKYDPAQLSFFAYLRMAARGDLLNVVDKQQRQAKRLVNIEAPEVESALPHQDLLTDTGRLEEWLQEHTKLSRQDIYHLLEDELDEIDQQLLMLMLEGVRDTEQFAAVMSISHLEPQAKRSEVKRAKDRLNKKLRRFGEKLGLT